MKRKTRKGTFETNSSSVHNIVISRKAVDRTKIPGSLHFCGGEFGWEVDEYGDPASKASYLFVALLDRDDRDSLIETIKNTLAEHGCIATFEEIKEDSWDNGYIDHSGYLGDFVDAVVNDKNMLLSYLFGNSIVFTANDNMDWEDNPYAEEIDSYENDGDYVTFYKGN